MRLRRKRPFYKCKSFRLFISFLDKSKSKSKYKLLWVPIYSFFSFHLFQSSYPPHQPTPSNTHSLRRREDTGGDQQPVARKSDVTEEFRLIEGYLLETCKRWERAIIGTITEYRTQPGTHLQTWGRAPAPRTESQRPEQRECGRERPGEQTCQARVQSPQKSLMPLVLSCLSNRKILIGVRSWPYKYILCTYILLPV